MGFGLTSSPTILEKCIWCITFYLQTEWTIFQPYISWHLVRSPKAPGVTEAKVWRSPYFIHTYTNTAFPSPDSFPLHPLNAGILYRLTLGAHLPKLQPRCPVLGCPWPSHVCCALKDSLNLSCAPVNALSPASPADKHLFIFQHLETRLTLFLPWGRKGHCTSFSALFPWYPLAWYPAHRWPCEMFTGCTKKSPSNVHTRIYRLGKSFGWCPHRVKSLTHSWP